MESAPRRLRGFLSGVMQGGYPFGYLCAAVAMQFIPSSRLGWQGMFLVGSVVAVLIVIVTTFAPESYAWKLNKMPSLAIMFRVLWQHIGVFAYLLLLMTMMSCLSHGTQDLYPDFLRTLPFMNGAKVIAMKASLGIPVLYNVGAIVGALIVGQMSEKLGRRYAIILALFVSLLSIPAWAFGHSVLTIAIGAWLMQFGVQGAFGVIPAHLNELSPAAIRGLFPGFVYQLGVLVASPILPAQNLLRQRVGYPWALTIFETSVIVILLFIYFFGPENRGRDFRHKDTQDFRIETVGKA
jgi:SHS family lactate transporter-like MFS transporter